MAEDTGNMVAPSCQAELNNFMNMTPNVIFRNSSSNHLLQQVVAESRLPPNCVPQNVSNTSTQIYSSNISISSVNNEQQQLTNISPQQAKKSSFQITSVLIDSSTSNDGGDSDESHTEESQELLPMDTPRNENTIQNLLTTQSNFSRNDTFFNPAHMSSPHVPVIPTSPNYGLAIDVVGHNTNKETLTPEHHENPDHVHHRFKVVKILSSGACKKGRWACMDYFDESAANKEIGTKSNSNVSITAIPDNGMAQSESVENCLHNVNAQQTSQISLPVEQEQIQNQEQSSHQQLPIAIQRQPSPEPELQNTQSVQQAMFQQTAQSPALTSLQQNKSNSFEVDLAQLAQSNSSEPSVQPTTGAQIVSQQPSQPQHLHPSGVDGSASGSSVAIDNKIEQAMDLVKSHLMFAVREEVEVLKEKISELMDRISQLEYENTILKANASHETLETLAQIQSKSSQHSSNNNNTC